MFGIRTKTVTILLAHLLLSECEEIGGLLHHESHLVSHLIPDFYLFSIGHLHRVRLDILLNKVVGHLLGDLHKNRFGESYWIRLQSPERSELNNIPISIFILSAREKRSDVAIKSLHLTKVSIADSYNDN